MTLACPVFGLAPDAIASASPGRVLAGPRSRPRTSRLVHLGDREPTRPKSHRRGDSPHEFASADRKRSIRSRDRRSGDVDMRSSCGPVRMSATSNSARAPVEFRSAIGTRPLPGIRSMAKLARRLEPPGQRTQGREATPTSRCSKGDRGDRMTSRHGHRYRPFDGMRRETFADRRTRTTRQGRMRFASLGGRVIRLSSARLLYHGRCSLARGLPDGWAWIGAAGDRDSPPPADFAAAKRRTARDAHDRFASPRGTVNDAASRPAAQ